MKQAIKQNIKKEMTFNVNGQEHTVLVDIRRTLLEVLRETLGLTGTKEMCNKGDCGGCTVLMDGRPILSCLTLAIEAQNKLIVTIEGLADGYKLHPLQQAFVESGAIQCGYCTPGFIMSAKALLDRNPRPTEDEIKEGIANNICRCTGYVQIIEAIQTAAQSMPQTGSHSRWATQPSAGYPGRQRGAPPARRGYPGVQVVRQGERRSDNEGIRLKANRSKGGKR
jgi:aerobic carbon-monoxide dehydrogenase small subunit